MTFTLEEFEKLCDTPAGNRHTDQGPVGDPDRPFWYWLQQDKREFQPMFMEVANIEPKRILEIGSAHGGGLIFWDRLVGPTGQVISIDYSDSGVAQWTMDYSTCTSQISFLPLNSHNQATLEKVKSILTGPVDFLFIDGDHSYEGVKMDYEMYSPLVRPGGLIGFHDISYDTAIQVGRFFNTIDKPKRKIEFSHGIGIVYN